MYGWTPQNNNNLPMMSFMILVHVRIHAEQSDDSVIQTRIRIF